MGTCQLHCGLQLKHITLCCPDTKWNVVFACANSCCAHGWHFRISGPGPRYDAYNRAVSREAKNCRDCYRQSLHLSRSPRPSQPDAHRRWRLVGMAGAAGLGWSEALCGQQPEPWLLHRNADIGDSINIFRGANDSRLHVLLMRREVSATANAPLGQDAGQQTLHHASRPTSELASEGEPAAERPAGQRTLITGTTCLPSGHEERGGAAGGAMHASTSSPRVGG